MALLVTHISGSSWLRTLSIGLIVILATQCGSAIAQQGQLLGSVPASEAPASAPAAEPSNTGSMIQTDGTGRLPTEILLPHDLSPWSMFRTADNLVKGVMIGLTLASLLTWTVFFAKVVEFSIARRNLRGGLARLEGARSFPEAKLALGPRDRVLGTFLGAVLRELEQSDRPLKSDGIKERVASRLGELAKAENQGMRRGMPLLATIGSTAPFVGLFGTVWGIMNAFIGISKAQTTNLAVVAPGIAEALLATAIGLVAAIPAVIIYNQFAQAGRRHNALVSEASGSVLRLLSRELDRRSAGAAIEAAG